MDEKEKKREREKEGNSDRKKESEETEEINIIARISESVPCKCLRTKVYSSFQEWNVS